MKNLVSGVAFAMVAVSGAYAASPYATRTNAYSNLAQNYNRNYNISVAKPTNDSWYIGLRADFNLLNWTNKYVAQSDMPKRPDDVANEFSFEPVFGGSFLVGKNFDSWRLDIEAGYIGYFEDRDNKTEFTLQIPYAMLNAYYDFDIGFYLGAGVGAAMPITTIDAPDFADGSDRKNYGFAPMISVMLGWSWNLDDNVALDLRYRLAGLMGSSHKFYPWADANTKYYMENKIDFILDNSISLGLRYEF